jgi:hypothetical protein
MVLEKKVMHDETSIFLATLSSGFTMCNVQVCEEERRSIDVITLGAKTKRVALEFSRQPVRCRARFFRGQLFLCGVNLQYF